MDDPLDGEVPFDESYWVVPHQLLAGETPASQYFDERTRHRLDALLDVGIRCFIDLTDPDEGPPYADQLFELASWYDHDVVYGNYPLGSALEPDIDQISAVLDVIDGSLAEDQPVYVHCLSGIGRTGTVVGCYLVRHGMNGEQALAALAELRQHMPNAWQRSPESDAQVNVVRNWQHGQ